MRGIIANKGVVCNHCRKLCNKASNNKKVQLYDTMSKICSTTHLSRVCTLSVKNLGRPFVFNPPINWVVNVVIVSEISRVNVSRQIFIFKGLTVKYIMAKTTLNDPKSFHIFFWKLGRVEKFQLICFFYFQCLSWMTKFSNCACIRE